MRVIYISLGSNVGDRVRYLSWAREALVRDLTLTGYSSIYESEPVGYTRQGDYLNQVLEFRSDISIDGLFDIIRRVEGRIGRQRRIKWGPRTIDIDILLYGDEVIERVDLIIPHLGLTSRRFVLEPLCELASDIIIPSTNRSVGYYMDNVMDQAVNIYKGLMYEV